MKDPKFNTGDVVDCFHPHLFMLATMVLKRRYIKRGQNVTTQDGKAAIYRGVEGWFYGLSHLEPPMGVHECWLMKRLPPEPPVRESERELEAI